MSCAYCITSVLPGPNGTWRHYGPANGICAACNTSYDAHGRPTKKQAAEAANPNPIKDRAKEYREELTDVIEQMRNDEAGVEAVRAMRYREELTGVMRQMRNEQGGVGGAQGGVREGVWEVGACFGRFGGAGARRSAEARRRAGAPRQAGAW